LSVRTINRAFNATGQTVGETIRIRRLARARNELAELRQPVGLSRPSGFRRQQPLQPLLQSLLRHVTEGVPRRPRPGWTSWRGDATNWPACSSS